MKKSIIKVIIKIIEKHVCFSQFNVIIVFFLINLALIVDYFHTDKWFDPGVN